MASKSKKGLGRGLGALFDDSKSEKSSEGFDFLSDLSDTEIADSDSIKMIKVRDIEPNKNQPRKTFDKEKLEILSSSIATHGIVQPILVKPNINGTYMIVAGERRWRAAKLAKIKEVPCVIRQLDEPAVMEIALIENLQREDLNPIEEAEGYRRLMETCELTQEEVAERIGVSRQAVAKWETGQSVPDILNCDALAKLYDVELDDLIHYDQGQTGESIPPKGKHIF